MNSDPAIFLSSLKYMFLLIPCTITIYQLSCWILHDHILLIHFLYMIDVCLKLCYFLVCLFSYPKQMELLLDMDIIELRAKPNLIPQIHQMILKSLKVNWRHEDCPIYTKWKVKENRKVKNCIAAE